MLFDNNEEMWMLYKDHANQEGLLVNKLTSKRGSDENVKYATFACGRSNKSESKTINMLKPKLIVKIGCEARIKGCVNEDEKWIFRTLNL